MKTIALSLGLMLMASCSQVDSEETVLRSAWEIYSKANVEPQDMSVFTSSFNRLVDAVNKADSAAELGYIDHVLLTQSQDSVDITGIRVLDISDSTSHIRVAKAGADTLRVVLKKENGSWKVDDVDNERKQMIDYCKMMGSEAGKR